MDREFSPFPTEEGTVGREVGRVVGLRSKCTEKHGGPVASPTGEGLRRKSGTVEEV